MSEAGESSNFSTKISRRKFLAGVGATAGVAMIDSLTNQRFSKAAGSKVAGALEVSRSLRESAADYRLDEVSISQQEEVLSEPSFQIERLLVKVKGENRDFEAVLATFNPQAQASIEKTEDFRRESLLAAKQPRLVGPVGYLQGDYHRDAVVSEQERRVSLKLAGRDSRGENYGENEIVDRFPGLRPEINSASGGLIIDQQGKVRLGNKKELIQAQSEGRPFLQMVYYLDNQNQEQVLSQKWHHFGKELEIGNTSYFFGAYVEYVKEGAWRSGYVVFDKDMVPIRHLVKLVEGLSETSDFRLALADAGNGSSLLVSSDKLEESKAAYGVNEFNTHYSPLGVVIEGGES
ncbi:MAG: hypothetical protein ABIB61_00780 [Candidatus Shapirobacteria bacterium]